jgi:hypothetical protein
MRHYLSARTIPGLAGGVVEATGPAPLIAMAGTVERGAAGVLRTGARAVPLSAVTHPAQIEELATLRSSADDQPQRIHTLPRSGRRGWTTMGRCAKKGAASRALP